MSELEDLIRAAKESIAEPVTARHEVLLGGELVVFEFAKLEPMEWRNLTSKFPPRDGAIRDLRLGYNPELLPSGYPVERIKLVREDELEEVTDEQWQDIFSLLESPDIKDTAAVLWGMHEWEHQQKVVEVKKASLRAKSSS